MKTYQSEVIVAGGGPAGVCAAIAAARAGAKVLLVEQYGCLGGMSTMGMVSPWMTFHDIDGNQVIYGIAQEIVDRMAGRGMSRGHVPDTMGETATITPFDNEGLKLILEEMCGEAGVEVLLHTFVFGTELEHNHIARLHAANKDGAVVFEANVFIDATGDGDIFARAGCAYAKGREEDGLMQPMTMMFSMGGVDFEKVRAYMAEHISDFHHKTRKDQLEELPNSVSGFFSKWRLGSEQMELDIKRDRILFFRGFRDDIANVNTTRILGADPTSAEDLTRAELEGRKQAWQVASLMKQYVPGFERAYILNIASAVGIREGRRLEGRYVLQGEDLQGGRMFEDTIAVYAYPIDQHQPDGPGFTEITVPQYGIPYRCMLPVAVDNLIVAGRCISATREAQSSFRLTPGCMAIGQAAGTAAAIAVNEKLPPADIDIKKLRTALIQNNVFLK